MIYSDRDCSRFNTKKGETVMSDMPEWLTELLSRLSEVFSKLLIKLGLKIIF